MLDASKNLKTSEQFSMFNVPKIVTVITVTVIKFAVPEVWWSQGKMFKRFDVHDIELRIIEPGEYLTPGTSKAGNIDLR